MTNFESTLVVIVVFAILIQFCVDRVKELVGERVMSRINAPVWAVAFGILYALMFDIDFFELMGFMTSVPILSKIITGLILSSGSTGVHELLAKLRDSRT